MKSVLSGGAFRVGAVAVAFAGGIVLAYSMRPTGDNPEVVRPMSAAPAASVANTGEPVMTLSTELLTRANVKLHTVTAATIGADIQIPGVVEQNPYRQVAVSTVAAGRVTRVSARLGQHVRRGEAVAELYSPEFAEAQSIYLSAAAEVQAHDLLISRLDRLVEIGSVSRQELEGERADHITRLARRESARSRLGLFGMTGNQLTRLTSTRITSTIVVRSPIKGVVIAREANAGINVLPGTVLLSILDLANVWIVGELYEADFAKVQVGSPATVSFGAYPDVALRTKVSYVDPFLRPDTRTVRVRAQVDNKKGTLRVGMFATLRIAARAGHSLPVVPKSAIQTIGEHTVVYVAERGTTTQFVERTIRTGADSGEVVAVLSGLAVGEVVVSQGSFVMRAERQKRVAVGPATSASGDVQAARVTVTAAGFEPNHLRLNPGAPSRITFVRATDATCAKEVTLPSLNIRRALPLNEEVTVELPPFNGELRFSCGMNMFRGALVAASTHTGGTNDR